MSTTTTPVAGSFAPDSRAASFHTYLEALSAQTDFARHFDADVNFTIMGMPTVRGRAEVEGTIRAIHQQMFDVRVDVRAAVVERDRAMVELQFVGTHVGEFNGVPATGRTVDVPYSAAYDFSGDGGIRAIRIYFPMHVLMGQIT